MVGKRWRAVTIFFTLMIGTATLIIGCQGTRVLPNNQQLPAVAPLPLPSLPSWITEISPTQDAEPTTQVRARFESPLIPLERLDTPKQKDVLKKFEILPPVPGRFRFLTPQMVGFQSDRALPKATRLQVKLKSGLKDLDGNALETDLAWTFATEPIQLSNLPGLSPEEAENRDIPIVGLEPELEFTANVALKLGSVRANTRLTPADDPEAAPVRIKVIEIASDFTPEDPQSEFDPSLQRWRYQIVPTQPLQKDTLYRLEIGPGLEPVNGNLPSEEPIVNLVKTYAPLAFEGVEYYGKPGASRAFGRFQNGAPTLEFNNGLVADTAIVNLQLSPAPEIGDDDDVTIFRAYDDGNSVNINPWVLEPNTDYTITLGRGIEDGFGQTLGEELTAKFQTGDLAAEIWAPDGLHIFPASQDLNLNISAVNLPESNYRATYRAVEPTDLVYVENPYPSDRREGLLPPTSAWSSYSVPAEPNVVQEIAIPLRERLGGNTGMLAYGVQAKTNRYQRKDEELWREPTYTGTVQLTNLGVFAQWFPDGGFARVHHLDDGSPAANATIELYQSKLGQQNRPRPTPCAVAIADASGTVQIAGDAWQRCLQGQKLRAWQGPEILAIARENNDWAYTRTSSYSGSFGYGISAQWQPEDPLVRGTIFSDRELYQPGETAALTGMAYYLRDGELQQDKNVPYQLSLRRPDGKTVDLGNNPTNDYGTFARELEIASDWPLGNYSLRAKSADGIEITGTFRVAEFKPPNFKVDLDLDREQAVAGEEVQATVQSDYLFGAPVQGGRARFFATRNRTVFTPNGWEEFRFGQQWVWPEEPPELESNILEAEQELDADGRGQQAIEIDRELPYPVSYRIDAEVADVSNLAVTSSQSFTALPGDRFVGLDGDFVADAGKPFILDVVAVDAEGQALGGDRIELELQKIEYSSVTQVVAGSVRSRPQINYETVEQAEAIADAERPVQVSFMPQAAGSYRIRAKLAQDETGASIADWQIWVSGDTPTYWGDRYTNNRLNVRLDKDNYQPGETATALIESPYEAGELYFAVIRDGILHEETLPVSGSAPRVQFEVTPEMLPNAAVEAVLVRQGEPLSEIEEAGSLDKLVKVGFAPFQVDLSDRYLTVDVGVAREALAPGRQQTIELQLKDNRGTPTQGQITLMVVNEAILQLSGYRPPDLVELVYANQPISTRFSDNRPDVTLEELSSPITKGWGYGGGRSAGSAGTELRTDFRPLAYFNGSLATDAEGRARASFELPDDLTTWRVMAVATDGELHFGNNPDQTFLTTKPLLANPLLPQFVRPGDRFLGGLALTNTTDKDDSLAIDANLTGPVTLDDTAKINNQLRPGTTGYRLMMEASEPGTAIIEFNARSAGLSDAFSIPLSVKPHAATEQAIATGVTQDTATVPLNIDRDVDPQTGGLDISLAGTLVPELVAPARQTFAEDSLPCLGPLMNQLSIAASLQQLPQDFADFNPAQQANTAIEKLLELQQPDGGFASWPRAKGSNPYLTPGAARSLARARAAGFAVPPDAIANVRQYLNRKLASPDCESILCKTHTRLDILLAFAELGDRRSDFLADLYAQRETMAPLDRLSLARLLLQQPGWEQDAREWSDTLLQETDETGRSATLSLPDSWSWLQSATAAQAEGLQLAIARELPRERSDRLVQGLLNLRREGTWRNSYDNARALQALVAYRQTIETAPNFTATAKLDRQELLSGQFQGRRTPSQSATIPAEELPSGKGDLVFSKSGTGDLHYSAAYRYRLQGKQPGRFQGLRVTREVRQANDPEVIRRYGLYEKNTSFKIPTGEVYAIDLEIVTDRPVHHVAIQDPLPAGLEAIDTQFQTANPAIQLGADSWEIDYQRIQRDRIVAYADFLAPGVYHLNYLVRSVTPGTFSWPGAEAKLQYEPEQFGRTAASILEIEENE